jgi:tetratricopeptide (TPR) repeat protein
MRFLRALLNSGVFMIILLAAATLYLVYSDAIKREHGIDATNEASVPVAEAVVSTPAASTSIPESSVAQTEPAVTQAPIQAEPAFETQPPQQAQADYAPMMPAMDNGQQPYGMMPQFPMPEPGQMMGMPMPDQMMPPMGYQAPMEMPAMPQMSMMQPEMPPMPPAYQPMMPAPMMEQAPASTAEMSTVDRARAALFEGNLDLAKQAYQTELANNNDPDLHGELGNVYFAQQNWQDAAIEYAAAVEGLSAQGRFLQAQYVLGFLMQINPDMGQKAMMNLRATMYPQNN